MNNAGSPPRTISGVHCLWCHSSGDHLKKKTCGLTLTVHGGAHIITTIVYLLRCFLYQVSRCSQSVPLYKFLLLRRRHRAPYPSHALLGHIHLYFHCALTAEGIFADQHNNRDVSTPPKQLAKCVELHFVLKHQHGLRGSPRISASVQRSV